MNIVVPATVDIAIDDRFGEESVLAEACRACGAEPVAPDDVATLGTLRLAAIVRFLLSLCCMLASSLAESVGRDCESVSALASAAPEALDELAYRSRRNSGDSNFPSSHDVFPTGRGKRGGNAGATDGAGASPDDLAEEILASIEGDGAAEVDEILDGVERDVAEAASEKALRKDRDRSGRKASGKRPGGQKGHEGHGFRVPDKCVDLGEEVLVNKLCESCPYLKRCLEGATLSGSHSVYDIARVTITRKLYRVASMRCLLPQNNEGAAGGTGGQAKPDDGTDLGAADPPLEAAVTTGGEAEGRPAPEPVVLSGEFPEGTQGPNQYGPNLKALACAMFCLLMSSLDRSVAVLRSLTGTSVSKSTVWGFVQELGLRCAPAVEAIGRACLSEGVVGLDETGARVRGAQYWVHAVATEIYSFMTLHESRGREALDDMGFLECFEHLVLHDCWKVYFQFDNLVHALCGEHLLRELRALQLHFRACGEWAREMGDLLREICHERHVRQGRGETRFADHELIAWRARYDELVERGKGLNPLPERVPGKRGPLKRGRARALLDRMDEHADEFLRFMYDWRVDFTNNVAEKSFRLLKVRFKVSGTFRSYEGAASFVTVWSYLNTATKKGLDPMEAIGAAFEGKAVEFLFPDGVPEADIPEGCKGPTVRLDERTDEERAVAKAKAAREQREASKRRKERLEAKRSANGPEAA